jgi:superfamily I DNA/RNA helicase
MRLRQLSGFWLRRRERLGLVPPVRMLVLTFNRTLEGYVRALAESQVRESRDLELRVETFGKFARNLASDLDLQPAGCESLLSGLCRAFGGYPEVDFYVSEVEYLLGRFKAEDLEQYLSCRREGRGISPRMDRPTRQRLLDEVVFPYLEQKRRLNWSDWNDVALAAATRPAPAWDVIVVDETQDFSGNQVRAVLAHASVDSSVTFVLDSAQRIYPRGFTWQEVGVVRPNVFTLSANYRNTREIAAFARPIIDGVEIGDDGLLPNLQATGNLGDKPHVVVGKFGAQLAWALDNVVVPALAADESVVFLHPKGGGWFREIVSQLRAREITSVDLSRLDEWPQGDTEVALSTLHSAKGLEFDHVILIGLSQEVTPAGEEDNDSRLESLRRLLAMGIARAKQSVTVGYKASEASSLIEFLDPATFDRVDVP